MMRLNSVFGASFITANLILFLCFKNAGGLSTETGGAFFIFGDSSVDPGNNNYIDTTPENQANHKPYGLNGFFKEPTGRFSDGRIIVDYLAEYAGLPLIPPFLEPFANYEHGVNFASGGAGFLSTTNQGVAIDFDKQLNCFDKVRVSYIEKLGVAEAEKLISNAVYFISMGTNDYLTGYLGNPKMHELHTPKEYVWMVMQRLIRGIVGLHGKGARKFAFLSLGPLGCLPALRAHNPKGHDAPGCFEEANDLAVRHNDYLKLLLPNFQPYLKGFKYSNVNFYGWLLDRINDPTKYGFKEGVSACCGTGPHRGNFTCGGSKKDPNYELCDNPSEYIWFDSFHPTESIHEQFAEVLWEQPSCSPSLLSLKDLFFIRDQQTIEDVVDDPEIDQIF